MADQLYQRYLQEDSAETEDFGCIYDEDMYGPSISPGEDVPDFGYGSYVTDGPCNSGVCDNAMLAQEENQCEQRGGAFHRRQDGNNRGLSQSLVSGMSRMQIHSTDSHLSKDSDFFSNGSSESRFHSYGSHCGCGSADTVNSGTNKANDSGTVEDLNSNYSSYNTYCNVHSHQQRSRSWFCEPALYMDEDGDTQLHLAVTQHREDTVGELLMRELPPNYINYKDANGRTALHLAVLTNQPELFQTLLQRRADPGSRDINGDTPLHVACQNSLLQSVRTLVSLITFLYNSTMFDPNSRNYSGFTCLHLAAANGHYAITSFLVNSFHVDINSHDGCSGRTILHHAADRGDRDFVEFLLSVFPKQLHINACAHDKQTTPLNLARGREYDDIVDLLQSEGAVRVSDYDLYLESDSEIDSDIEMC